MQVSIAHGLPTQTKFPPLSQSYLRFSTQIQVVYASGLLRFHLKNNFMYKKNPVDLENKCLRLYLF